MSLSQILYTQIFVGLAVGAVLLMSNNRVVQSKANDLLSRVIHRYLFWRYPIKHISGNGSLPTAPYRWPNGQGDVGKFLDGIENSAAWSKQYGPIYRIWSGTAGEVVLTRPEQLRAVFKDSDRHLKAVNNNSGYLMGQILGRCVGMISGNEWKTVRDAVEVPFLRKNAADLVPLIQQHVVTHVNELWQSGQLSKGLLDPVEDLEMLPFWVVAQIFYGQLSTGMIHDLKELVPQHEELFKYVIRGGLSRFSWSRFLPTKANTSLAAFQKRWKAFNDNAYQRAVRIQNGAPIIQMYEAVKQGRLSKDELYQTLDESLYANLDVTIGGLSWSLVFLAAHKGQQDLLLDEINSIDEDGFRRYILSSSSLLAACISESSRLKPVAAFSIPQSTPSTRIIDGYEIPAGTNFVVDAYGLNIRNEYWGNDSTVYRPQRFLEKADVELRYQFWRFGFGPRQCMGKHVADFITRALLIHILTRYELDLVEAGSEWERNRESWITHPQMQLRCVRRTSLSRNAEEDP